MFTENKQKELGDRGIEKNYLNIFKNTDVLWVLISTM